MKQQFIVAKFSESRKVSTLGPDVERIIIACTMRAVIIAADYITNRRAR